MAAERVLNEDTPFMFGIGYQEMFIVLVVALVIFGPSRLPELAGQVGRWVRDFRRMSADLTGEFEKTFAEVDEVKKTFKREMQSIQDEVEGVGKSARGDLKKSATRSTVAGKKATGGALKSGTGASAVGKTASGSTATGAASATQPVSAATRAKMPALEGRARAGTKTAKNGGAALPIATKADPLSDVSMFDLDAEFVATGNGAKPLANGSPPADADDAIGRVRRRRVTASYGQRHPA